MGNYGGVKHRVFNWFTSLFVFVKGGLWLQVNDEIQVDKYGRMLYHPEFHPNHKKPFTEEELEYLCKFWEYDGRRTMSYALGRPERNLQSLVSKLRKKGLFDYYKNLNKHW